MRLKVLKWCSQTEIRNRWFVSATCAFSRYGQLLIIFSANFKGWTTIFHTKCAHFCNEDAVWSSKPTYLGFVELLQYFLWRVRSENGGSPSREI